MPDVENNVPVGEVAPQVTDAQNEQGGTPAAVPETPQSPEDKGETLILGKFKSQEDLVASYQELERKLSHTGQKREQAAPYVPPTPVTAQDPVFDDETEQNLNSWYTRKQMEQLRAEESRRSAAFFERHKDELQDPILDATVRKVIADTNATGQVIDQEEALNQAKQILENWKKPAQDDAAQAAFKEGQDLAHQKQVASAVGSTSRSTPPKDVDQMSAEEMAEHYQLPRARQ